MELRKVAAVMTSHFIKMPTWSQESQLRFKGSRSQRWM